MDPTRAETDRKRKAEDDTLEETSAKRPLLDQEEKQQQVEEHTNAEHENDTYYEASDDANNTVQKEPKVEEYDPTAAVVNNEQEDKQQEEYDPTSSIKQEQEAKVEVKGEEVAAIPLETVVPYDRLIIIHVEATCDENPMNPAAVQVTKENSEIIGKYTYTFIKLWQHS